MGGRLAGPIRGGKAGRQGGPTEGLIGAPILVTDRGGRQGGPSRRAATEEWHGAPLCGTGRQGQCGRLRRGTDREGRSGGPISRAGMRVLVRQYRVMGMLRRCRQTGPPRKEWSGGQYTRPAWPKQWADRKGRAAGPIGEHR